MLSYAFTDLARILLLTEFASQEIIPLTTPATPHPKRAEVRKGTLQALRTRIRPLRDEGILHPRIGMLSRRYRKPMKIHIIQPTCYNPDGSLFQTRTRWIIGLTLPHLAGLVPTDHDVTVTDERLSPINFEEKYDLVAITTFSHASKRAYEIARSYNEKGTKVVMGGWHVSFRPDEALQHCDAVAVGEGEETFPAVIEDAEKGTLSEFYQAKDYYNLKELPIPRYDVLPLEKYRVKFYPVQTSRGCPFKCDFCEVSALYGSKFRFRPVDEVIEEIRHTGAKCIQFVDDNFAANRTHTRELMRKLIPLKVKWTCLWTVEASRDKELVKLAKRAGCCHVNMGMESLSQESLKEAGKKQNIVSNYREALKVLEQNGIFYSLNFIFGFDHDSADLFAETVRFCRQNRVPLAFFSVLCPRPGTERWNRLKAEGRLLTEDQSYFRGETCVFQPLNMMPDELEQGVWGAYRKFYSPSSILKRMARNTGKGFWDMFLSNLLFGWAVRRQTSPLEYY